MSDGFLWGPLPGVAGWSVPPHQQPEVNYLPRFSPQLISLERYTLSVYRTGEIDLFENLDIIHIRLLVPPRRTGVSKDCRGGTTQ